jgi:hypothetical protein
VKDALECWANRSMTYQEVDDDGEEVEETFYKPIWTTNRYGGGSFLPSLRHDSIGGSIELSTENQEEIEGEIDATFSIMYEHAVLILEKATKT